MSADRAPMTLPTRGLEWADIMSRMNGLKKNDFDWRTGRLPSYTYFYNDDVLEKQKEAYSAFIVENGLGAGLAFKSIGVMLDDIYAMAFELFHAPATAGASFTTGGTESIFEALRTAKEQARAVRGEPRGQYNLVTAISGHASLDKIAHILDVEVRRTPVDSEYRATAAAFEAAVDDRTIMLYASAPCFPYGVFDRIGDIGAVASKRDLWFHVDGCWGGFLSPFAKELGYPIPEWDLGVPGVTSISADLHKFGYAVKGASLILFRDKAVQKFEQFTTSAWPRGTYSTPTFMGSKPAGSVASAWAMMQYLGREGYLKATADTMKATDDLIAGVDKIPGLKCLEPHGESNLFTFVSTDPDVDLNAVAALLMSRGWMRGLMREPLGIHQGVVASHLPYVAEYLGELARAVDEVRASKTTATFNERTY